MLVQKGLYTFFVCSPKERVKGQANELTSASRSIINPI